MACCLTDSFQMPIVDGLNSTKMIRSFEKTHAGSKLSKRAANLGRTPIFAVSASLLENERGMYMDTGFDGWILKPIDFRRLTLLLSGIVDEGARDSCLYQPGRWEQGGWFSKAQPDVFSSNTVPSPTAPVSSAKPINSFPVQPEISATDQERDRLRGLEDDAVHGKSRPVDPGDSGNIQKSLEGEGSRQSLDIGFPSRRQE